MGIVTGTVDKVSTQYGKYSVLVDGVWYGTKEEWAKVKPNEGDQVSFDDGGGKFTKNMRIVVGGAAPSPAASGASVAPAKPPTGRSFPVAALAPERTINRQNALTAACNTLGSIDSGTPYSLDTVALNRIELARKFEAYTTGDLDKEQAADAMKAMES